MLFHRLPQTERQNARPKARQEARRSPALLVLLALIWAALWPALSMATSPAEVQSQRGLQVLICGQHGTRWVSLDELDLGLGDVGPVASKAGSASDAAEDSPNVRGDGYCMVCAGKSLGTAHFPSTTHWSAAADPVDEFSARPLPTPRVQLAAGLPPPSTAPPHFSIE